ncbi:MAG: hypothetical protein FJW30_22110 [Acidobacteria bacterium]|nr:hypothetical protein [Acidobacteriota bacterium]
MRIDAQHSFAPPGQGPEWFSRILARNRFEGSVYFPETDFSSALDLAPRYPYIRRVVAREIVSHPLVRSVFVDDAARVAAVEAAGLRVEAPAGLWPFASSGPVALHGFPAVLDLPDRVVIKLTGFTLPVSEERAARLRRFLAKLGPDRLMFASGWPFGGGTWKETLSAFTQELGAMPLEIREQLLGATARTFYQL